MQGIFFVIVSSAAAVVLPVLEYVAVSLLLLLPLLLPASPCPRQHSSPHPRQHQKAINHAADLHHDSCPADLVS